MTLNPNMYSQTDSRWRHKKYPSGGYNVGNSGCGLCAVTHLLIEQKKYWKATPSKFWSYMRQYALRGNGTRWAGIANGLKHFGHKSVIEFECGSNKSRVYKEFAKGNRMAVALVSAGHAPDGTVWTTSGHYVALLDMKVVKGKHYFYVKDSGHRHRRGWYCCEKSMGSRFHRVWIVKRLEDPAPPKPYVPKKIKVDGDWGKATTRLTQSAMGMATIDGIISSQPIGNKPYLKGANTDSWLFVSKDAKGSPTVKAVQKMVGVKEDGKWGKVTSKAVQTYLNEHGAKLKVDGYFGKISVKAWQTWLNAKVK